MLEFLKLLLKLIFPPPGQTEATESLEQLRSKNNELMAENSQLRQENSQLLQENLRLGLDESPNINQVFDEEDLAVIEQLVEKCQQLEDDNLNSPTRHK